MIAEIDWRSMDDSYPQTLLLDFVRQHGRVLGLSVDEFVVVEGLWQSI